MQSIKKLIPHLLTAGNLVGGILAIIFIMNGYLNLAPLAIFASAIFDFLDGFVARLLGVPSELGKQLDSLADMVTFGVAPGILVLYLFDLSGNLNIPEFYMGSEIRYYVNDAIVGTEILEQSGISAIPIFSGRGELNVSSIWALSSLLIPICAMFRLAKFNLDENQSDSFKGLPTPAMTIFFAAIPLMIVTLDPDSWSWQIPMIGFLLHPICLALLSILFSIFMVVNLPLFALKFKSFGWKGNEIRYIFLTISAALLATLFVWALPLIIILYILLSIINNIVNKPKNEVQSGN